MRIGLRSGVAVASVLAGIWLASAPGRAQQNPAMQNPSVAQPNTEAPPPLPGANSFAEPQARKLLESQGYKDVSPLVNDSQGIWRGTAMNGASKVQVSVDYKGNVSAHP